MLLECSGKILKCKVGDVDISKVDVGWEQFVPFILQTSQHRYQVFNDTEAYSNINHANFAMICDYGILFEWMLLTQSTSSIMSPEPPPNITGVSIVPKRLPVSELCGDVGEATFGCAG